MRQVLDIGRRYPEITGPFSDAFTSELNNACVAGNFTALVLDLSGTIVINSLAMSAIFMAHQKLQGQGKSIQIINASNRVKHLFRMVNMLELLM